jgi:large subunit ribosomal protein L13
MTTQFASPNSVTKNWYVVDASNMILGRLASKVAFILMGKNKPDFSKNIDTGDNVVVINASQIKLTGNKALEKEYFSHSTYPGGSKILSFEQLQKKDPGLPVEYAIKGMLPKNSRGRTMIKKLHVYGGSEHPHHAQKPQPIEL